MRCERRKKKLVCEEKQKVVPFDVSQLTQCIIITIIIIIIAFERERKKKVFPMISMHVTNEIEG